MCTEACKVCLHWASFVGLLILQAKLIEVHLDGSESLDLYKRNRIWLQAECLHEHMKPQLQSSTSLTVYAHI